MAEVFRMMERVCASQSTLLLEGESGTGKELVAREIHRLGPICEKPFLVIDCSSLSPQILDSQLFGHQKGSFSGAIADYEGLMVQGQGGTVFLDDVGSMPLEIQGKFLRFLQEGEIRPLGSREVRKVQTRIIASSRLPLSSLVAEGKFREDLFYRLNILRIHLPPLRDRREDIPILIDSFLNRNSQKTAKPLKSVSQKALRALCFAHWPGNVRQLENALEQIVVNHVSKKIELEDLPEEIQNPSSSDLPLNLDEAKNFFLKKYIEELLVYCQGNISKAHKISGMDRAHIHRLMHKLGIKKNPAKVSR
jgi:two-component system response regulator GlrR